MKYQFTLCLYLAFKLATPEIIDYTIFCESDKYVENKIVQERIISLEPENSFLELKLVFWDKCGLSLIPSVEQKGDSIQLNFNSTGNSTKIIDGDTLMYFDIEEDCTCAYSATLKLKLQELDIKKLMVNGKFLELTDEKFKTFPIWYSKDSTFYNDKYGLRQGHKDFQTRNGFLLRTYYLNGEPKRHEVLNSKLKIVFSSKSFADAKDYIDSKDINP